ncbi:MAG: hypothetical protein J6O23_09110 [Prevotella sp.]|nr:hypothetical protein [Prevotella sp.]
MNKTTLLTTFLVLLLTACGSDDDPTPTPVPVIPPTPATSITVESQSISDGAEVDASTTTRLTLTYNVKVRIHGNADITLNGTRLLANVNTSNSKAIDIPFRLQDSKDYTLQMTEGSVVALDDSNTKAPAFKLTFRTAAKEEPQTGSLIPAEPLTASTEPARKLYHYLLQQYGKKTVSSVMANVNWNNDCAEKIYKLTGKYPAMNCYDFIHICYSAPNSWINYEDTKPVTDWVDAGGLVQLMWHFNVPKSENSADNAFYIDGNNFKPSRAVTSGTWENKWFYEQMDKVINILLKLQEAGIAATWRPFHEAAGNATARQQAGWTKAWFWWGIEGAEAYKRLWHAMFDYFKQKGVRNLIWVWTTQNYNGNSSQYNQDTNWYPGDQYVDIVARDLYGCDVTQNKKEFLEIQERYPSKMVALGECGDSESGTAALPGDFWTAGALWSHFMVWYQQGQGSTDTMCSDSWWKKAMSNPNVITRDKVPNLK